MSILQDYTAKVREDGTANNMSERRYVINHFKKSYHVSAYTTPSCEKGQSHRVKETIILVHCEASKSTVTLTEISEPPKRQE